MFSRFKLAVFVACLIPLGQLLYNAWAGDLTANPIEFITHFTGDWSLIFLLATLSVTPLRKLLGWNDLIKFRRMLGLFAFFYVLLHFSTYMVLDHIERARARIQAIEAVDTLGLRDRGIPAEQVRVLERRKAKDR